MAVHVFMVMIQHCLEHRWLTLDSAFWKGFQTCWTPPKQTPRGELSVLFSWYFNLGCLERELSGESCYSGVSFGYHPIN